MVNLLIRNITDKELKVSYILNGIESKVVLQPNDFVISEQPITSIVKILEKRGFLYMETAEDEKIKNYLKEPIVEEIIEDEPIKEIEEKKKYIRPGAWSKKDINFLKKYYPKYGSNFCVIQLGRTAVAIQNKVKELDIKKDKITYIHVHKTYLY